MTGQVDDSQDDHHSRRVNRVAVHLVGSEESEDHDRRRVGPELPAQQRFSAKPKRTREIGIRLAVGARGRDILVQFLPESLTLSVIGGGIGVGLGIAGSLAIASASGWPLRVWPDALAVAFGSAGAIGMFFGVYPAQRASLLDPIEALRG